MKLVDIVQKRTSKFVFDKKLGIEDTILLASMGRSGSTFLSNIINYDNSFRVLFEPFRFDIVEEAKDFVYPFYLRPNDNEPNYFSSAQKILLGQINSEWVDRENRTIFPKARLIKDIRVNFFLKWIYNNFPEMKVILLLRHPCAVVNSWLSAGFGDGRIGRERLLSNHHFVTDMDDYLVEEYLKAESAFERLIFFWCFSYKVPFQQFSYGDIYLVFYENLILHPRDEIKLLFNFLKYRHSEEKVLNSLSKPSSTTTKNESFFYSNVLRVDQWKSNCSSEQLTRAYEIMNLFGMEALYCPATSIPNIKAATSLFGSE